MLKHVFMLMVIAAVCGCSATAPSENSESLQLQPQTKTITMVLECERNLNFVARLEGETLWAFLPKQTLAFEAVISASGAKYQKGTDYIWLKGENAMVNYQQSLYKQCANNRQEAIWQDAKFRGVSFRAVGNEPGWVLEIKPSESIEFSGNYGQQVINFNYVAPIESANSSQFNLAQNDNLLSFELRNTACRDTMSDQVFSATVSGKLNGKPFVGCGRALF